MNKLLLSLAITASFASSAIAADLPVKARPMAPAPVVATNWTGCYVGAGGGYGMFWQRHQTVDTLGVPFTNYSADAGGRGWFGTVQVGCDYQVAPRWVIGAFADWDFGSIRGDLQLTAFPVVGEERLRNSWAAGGRVGYLIFPGLLGYVSGGYTEARFSGVTLFNQFGPAGVASLSMDAQTYKGWFIGTGYEYALDFLPGLFWKSEYRYASYGDRDVGIFAPATVGGAAATLVGYERSRKDVQTIRSELVYRFNFGGGPVMARY